MSTNESRAAEIKAASRAVRESVLAATKDLPTKACSRCGGSGAYFMGTDRAPGDCYLCGGSGKVLATREGRRITKNAQDQAQLQYLRCYWKVTNEELQALKANPLTGWAHKHAVKSLEQQLQRIVEAGKALASIVEGANK